MRRVYGLMTAVANGSCCPCHSHSGKRGINNQTVEPDYAFEMASSNIRFGVGVTKEVGMDVRNLGDVRSVCIVTDRNISKLPVIQQVVLPSLKRSGVEQIHLYDRTRIEPTDESFKDAAEFAKQTSPDVFIAVGGGSSIDTAKAANLYYSNPSADFLDYVNAPIGKGLPVTGRLKPLIASRALLIAVPTTSGTGSETTGAAIFDYLPLKAKTGIAHRNLKPLLGIVDPMNAQTMPLQVILASGLDVLCHSMESYTAIPYDQRTPRPDNPINRPAYQGANPISDIWSMQALRMVISALPRVLSDPQNRGAQAEMMLAATYAGIGFGNAGVHLCHGMSYPISGLVGKYVHPQYPADHSIIPHGISVAISAPAVFSYTAESNPERHLLMAKAFGRDVDRAKKEDAGEILGDCLRSFLFKIGVPNGLDAFGYSKADIPALIEGTLPQSRVLKLAPLITARNELQSLFEKSIKLY